VESIKDNEQLKQLKDMLVHLSESQDLFDIRDKSWWRFRNAPSGKTCFWIGIGCPIIPLIIFRSLSDWIYIPVALGGIILSIVLYSSKVKNKNSMAEADAKINTLYGSYSDKCVPFEYFHPEALKELIKYIAEGKAQSITKSIICVQNDAMINTADVSEYIKFLSIANNGERLGLGKVSFPNKSA